MVLTVSAFQPAFRLHFVAAGLSVAKMFRFVFFFTFQLMIESKSATVTSSVDHCVNKVKSGFLQLIQTSL